MEGRISSLVFVSASFLIIISFHFYPIVSSGHLIRGLDAVCVRLVFWTEFKSNSFLGWSSLDSESEFWVGVLSILNQNFGLEFSRFWIRISVWTRTVNQMGKLAMSRKQSMTYKLIFRFPSFFLPVSITRFIVIFIHHRFITLNVQSH